MGFLLTLVLLATPQPQTPGVVGKATCQTCHADTHERWQASRHSKMVQPATTESVVGDFSRGRIQLRGQPYGLERRDGKFFIAESFMSPDVQRHEIQYTLGNRRIQHYLTTLPDGRIVVLPPSWDVLRQEWFHNLEIAAPDQKEEAGAVPVQVWNKNCFGCHVSEEVKNYDQEVREYRTEWLDFGGHCERCHGPGAAHVELYSADVAPSAGGTTEIVVPTRLDHDRNSQICAQCHSFRDIFKFGYTAGEDYFDYFFPLLEYTQTESLDPTWYPDGKTRRFSTNALGIWQSECFVKGGVACTSCHIDTHVPEIEQNRQLRPENHALCTGCHADIGEDVTAHTFHEAESTGSACVECHMPRSVVSLKAQMRDHSISIPAPENTARFGIPNACTLCHDDRSVDWAKAALDEWYPNSETRAKIIRRADAFGSARAGESGSTEKLLALIADVEQGPFARANALGHLAGIDDPRAFPALAGALDDPHPMVRSIAALKLSERADDRTAPTARARLADAMLDDKRVVRMNAAISLLNLGVQRLQGEAGAAFEIAKSDHAERGAFYADDAPQQLNLGRFHVLRGQTTEAAESFENSYELNPDQPGIKFFMAITRMSQNQHDEARALLESVGEDDPFAEPARDLLRRLSPP